MVELDRFFASSCVEISQCNDLKTLNQIKVTAIGKDGKITKMMQTMKNLPKEQKIEFGAKINSIKDDLIRSINAKREELEAVALNVKLSSEMIEITMPVRPCKGGKLHPLTKVFEEASEILHYMGCRFCDGPDIESEYYNFTALNMPEHHPARTMQDTFYLDLDDDEFGKKLLRTHTSPVQVRSMLKYGAPCKLFSIGRTYRSDYDATHTPMFNQIEALVIDKEINFAHLKWFIMEFLRLFFGVKELNIRLRPSFFPFTEPSAEVDMQYHKEGGKIIFGSGDQWIEMGGCGIVHPSVLSSGKIDSDQYQGFAFGIGLERLTSLKYGIPDLREYFESTSNWRSIFGFGHYQKF